MLTLLWPWLLGGQWATWGATALAAEPLRIDGMPPGAPHRPAREREPRGCDVVANAPLSDVRYRELSSITLPC